MYGILADGDPWIDSDGKEEWSAAEVAALAEVVEHLGYEVEITPPLGAPQNASEAGAPDTLREARDVHA